MGEPDEGTSVWGNIGDLFFTKKALPRRRESCIAELAADQQQRRHRHGRDAPWRRTRGSAANIFGLESATRTSLPIQKQQHDGDAPWRRARGSAANIFGLESATRTSLPIQKQQIMVAI